MASVSVRHVFKAYPAGKGRETTAVRDVSLEIADREFIVLVGPSGCGKSTVLRMIAGLDEISQGEVFIGDRRMNDVAPKDRDIAMMFQNYALYPHLSVYDNLAFGLKLRKFPKAEIRKRVNDAAGILGIEKVLDRKPKTLSDEQRQRAALGRAIVRQPKVFLFDEPLSCLDAKVRGQMRAEITKLHQRLQATMIYVTPDPIEAMTIGDGIVVMNDGAVQQIGAPLALYHEPANLFVASFLGTPPMNFIKGTLKQDGDSIRFREIEGGTIEVSFVAAERPAAREFIGKEVILGLRPEHLQVEKFNSKQRPAAGSRFGAIVDIVEPMGAETNVYLQTGAHTLVCRSQQALDRQDAGHRVQCELSLSKAHLFDAISTNRIV